MTELFANLVGRHLGTCETVQPRTPSRFEAHPGGVVPAYPHQGPTAITAVSDRTMKSMSEASDASSNEPASERKLTRAAPVRRTPLVEEQRAFLTEGQAITERQADPVGNRHQRFSAYPSRQRDQTSRSGFTDQHAVLPAYHALPGDTYETPPLAAGGSIHPEALQQDNTNQTGLLADELADFSGRQWPKNTDITSEAVPRTNPTSTAEADGDYAENNLDNRLRALLQRLAGDALSSITQRASDAPGKPIAVHPLSPAFRTQDPLPGSAVTPRETTNTSNRLASGDNSRVVIGRDPGSPHGQLESPSWLPEIEARFSQRIREIETKADPVINVTIGRVEVRAVHAETRKDTGNTQKPTGVMSLDEYLKQREGSGTR